MRKYVALIALLLADACTLWVVPYIALWLRFDGQIPPEYLPHHGLIFVARVALTLAVFVGLGLYSRVWLYATMRELGLIVLGGLAAQILYIVQLGVQTHWLYPRTVMIMFGIFAIAIMGVTRLMARVERAVRARLQKQDGVKPSQPVVIVGAGDAGYLAAHACQFHAEWALHPIAFLDDDTRKWGLHVAGVRVEGATPLLERIIEEKRVKQVWVAMPDVTAQALQKIVQTCSRLGVHCRIVPQVGTWADGQFSVRQLQRVKVEDVLGRPPVELDSASISEYLSGKRVLVTGAAGSIGSELCRQILRFNPEALTVVDADEYGLWDLERSLQHLTGEAALQIVLGNVRDAERMRTVMANIQPQVVFHAAAYKHVPIGEIHPSEMVKTNIQGTWNVAQAAIAAHVERFVLISTDKAVKPSSFMGATKRIAEMICLFHDHSTKGATQFMAVRFGNVLDSRGSVVPIFRKQIDQGGPVTVTHPEMTRYFMLISEAAQLVLQAGAVGNGGEVLVLDMGQPVRIIDLAENMVRLAGFQPQVDIPIIFTGIRRGEKLHEELLTEQEEVSATQHRRIFVAKQELPSDSEVGFVRRLRELLEACDSKDGEHLRAMVRQMVPTYCITTSTSEEANVSA